MTAINIMSGAMGDIFWDLAPWITYEPSYDLGCSIYVANQGDTEREYALMARLAREGTVISEEALPVFGLTWFKVAPGDFIKLKGALRFDESDSDLTVLLIERESNEVTDSVVTTLVSPANAALPPAWPGATTSGFDWNSLLFMMVPVMMLGAVIAASRPGEEKQLETAAAKEERKLLPEGRRENAR